MFSSYAPRCCYVSPTKGSKPWVVFWHHDIATMPPHLHLPPNAKQMLQHRTAVCLPNKWKNLLDRDNNADKWNHGPTLPQKSASAYWQYDAGYRVNSPLGPCLYQVLNAIHHLLNDTNPQLAGDCWLCLSLGAPWYLATPVPLNIATAMGTPIDPPLQGPVFFFFMFILIGS